ncbi:MAG: hypothetical protein R3C49_03910 [Planctomycetaceae bacterium]
MDQVVRMTRRRALEPSFDACQIRPAVTTKEQGAIAAIMYDLTKAAGPRISE